MEWHNGNTRYKIVEALPYRGSTVECRCKKSLRITSERTESSATYSLPTKQHSNHTPKAARRHPALPRLFTISNFTQRTFTSNEAPYYYGTTRVRNMHLEIYTYSRFETSWVQGTQLRDVSERRQDADKLLACIPRFPSHARGWEYERWYHRYRHVSDREFRVHFG
jgi:hypothetical protein